MKLLPGAQKVSVDLDEVVGPVGVANVEPAAPRYEETGTVASILLGMFVAYLALRYLINHHYDLVFVRRGASTLNLTPVMWCYGLMSLFLIITAKRFSRMFAPEGVGHAPRIVLATLGIFLMSESFQPLVIVMSGQKAVGRWGNIFSGILDPAWATYGPISLGIVLMFIARVLPKVVVPVEAAPSDEAPSSG